VTLAEPVIVASCRGNFVGEVRDLSAGGMFIAIGRPVAAEGERLVVRILPAHPPAAIEVAGVVRWADERGIGLEIAGADGPASALLETLVACGN
jgi:hypothetical protein